MKKLLFTSFKRTPCKLTCFEFKSSSRNVAFCNWDTISHAMNFSKCMQHLKFYGIYIFLHIISLLRSSWSMWRLDGEDAILDDKWYQADGHLGFYYYPTVNKSNSTCCNNNTSCSVISDVLYMSEQKLLTWLLWPWCWSDVGLHWWSYC